ncbi:MAG: hypothetical protein EXS31_17495 [Pedosphaera sp.]|nr:hypothetical protein [Pedosphaera sp.]
MSSKRGRYSRVAENLWRYSTSKAYFAVFRHAKRVVWKNLKTTDRELASRRLKEEMEKAGKVDAAAGKMTLAELIRLYEESLEKFDGKTRASRKSFIKQLRATWKHGFDVLVRDITPAQVELWLAPHRQRMKKVSFNEYIRVVKHLFQLALASKVIAESPASGIKSLRKEDPERHTPTAEQVQAILSHIRRNQYSDHAQDTADLVEFMALAGVGMAECDTLRGEHIDLENGRIALHRSKTDTAFTIPVFPQVKPFLDRLKASGRIAVGKPVFKVRDPKKALIAACTRLKYPNFSSRSLRRHFITRCVELGIDFKTIAAWQGHRDGGVLIAKTYSHLRSEHSDAMAKRIVAA